MSSVAELLERESRNIDLEPGDFERLTHRRDRRQRNRRILSAVVALVVAGVAIGGLLQVISSGSVPADEPSSPFEGTWISTSDGDGGTQTMTVQVFAEGAVEIVVTDTIATVCGGTPSTMTGTGQIEGGTTLVIPAPAYTCDDGSEPQALSGPPLDEQLRDWTLFLDPESDTLSDGVGGVWVREGAEVPSPDPTTSGGMWPQTSLEEVRQAQELADAGDPDYTWQIDPELASETLYPWESEIVDRFLREELGWEEWAIPSGTFAGGPGGPYNEVMLIRCTPGRTNPLYPGNPADVSGCAPTIDDLRYETVRIDLDQPGLRGPSGIWAITGWEMLQPVEPGTFYQHLYPHYELGQVVQVAPPSDAEVDTLLQSFLQARVDGEGAEGYVHRHLDGWDDEEVPVMYATTDGSPYVQYEFDRRRGPVWPTGWIEFRVRLFAEDGIEVEQTFVAVRQEDGRFGLMYGVPFETTDFATTEDGQPVPVPYHFLDGEVTFAAATPDPWDEPWDGGTGDLFRFMLFGFDRSSMMIMADPFPVDPGCEPGSAPTDAAALARSIASNPDVEATAPVHVRVSGVDALRVDVTFGRRAGCGDLGLGPSGEGEGMGVVEGTSQLYHLGGQMRLYLLDLPQGMSARILGIAIVGPKDGLPCGDPNLTPCFERVLEAAAPTLDSFEFHAP